MPYFVKPNTAREEFAVNLDKCLCVRMENPSENSEFYTIAFDMNVILSAQLGSIRTDIACYRWTYSDKLARDSEFERLLSIEPHGTTYALGRV